MLIAVRDYGIGVPADQIPRIFERFYRARNAAMPHYSGLGLGLHISYEIVPGTAAPCGWRASRARAAPSSSPCP